MKAMRALAVLATLVLAACGDGSIQSPAFTEDLVALSAQVKATQLETALVPKGRTEQLEAIGSFTQPPPDEATPVERSTSANWSSDNTSVATVNAAGLVTAVNTGVARITASKDGKTSNTVTITVGPAALDSIKIVRTLDNTTVTADTIARGSQRSYRAVGVYSDTTERPITATWVSDDDTVATPALPGPATEKAIRVPLTATNDDTAAITVTSTEASEVSTTLTITASNRELVEVISVTFDQAPLPIGSTTQAHAIGRYSNNDEEEISNELIDWTSATPAVATIDNTGSVTAVTKGTTTITATLKAGAQPQITDPAARDASATLEISDAVCTTPLRTPAYEASTSRGGLICGALGGLGLLCSTTGEPEFVIDADDGNHLDLNLTVSLLGDSLSVDVTPSGAATTFPGTQPVGFVVGSPAGQLLAADVLSAVTVTTLLNGEEVETGNAASNTLQVDLLGFPLLPIGNIPNEAAAVFFQPTQPFNGVRLTYNSGLATALSSLQVYNACGTVAPLPETTE
ncbi:Ig-like domain-containing protein [Hydrocarboniphaga effusa]|uniref:Ig-like domain-containing protein n=2 Tax=Hydrocarboniphaga effusa TaxID=243629 RepID=UPI0031378BCF